MIRRFQFVIPVLLCLVAYVPALGSAFIFDSKPALEGNAAVQISEQSFSSWIAAAESSNTGPLGRPLSILSIAASYVAEGQFSPIGFKTVNLLLHLINGLLLWWISRAMLRVVATPDTSTQRVDLVAFLAASIWLLHPLHVSTVLYAVQRMAQLSTFFSLLAVVCYCHYRAQISTVESAVARRELWGTAFFWVLCCSALAAFSKENGLLAPWLIVLIELVIYRRFSTVRDSTSRSLMFVVLVVPLAILAGILLSPPVWLVDAFVGRDFSLQERGLTQLRVLWHYIYWWFVPDIRSLGFHHDDIVLSTSMLNPLSTAWAAVGWIVLTLSAVLTRQRFPIFSFSIGWFLISHSLESSIFPLEMVYEHRNYLAGYSLCLLIASVIVALFRGSTLRPAIVVGSLVLATLWFLLQFRAALWADEIKLTDFHLQHHPGSIRTQYHYANTRLRHAETEVDPDLRREMILNSRAAYSLMRATDPGNTNALVALLWIDSRYFDGLDVERWLSALDGSLKERKFMASDYNALGMMTECANAEWCGLSSPRFIQMMSTLAQRLPDNSPVLVQLARHYRLGLQRPDLAVDVARRALVARPGDRTAYMELIAGFAAQGDNGSALATIRTLLSQSSNMFELRQLQAMFEVESS
ncbi:MAG: hypothetical protein ACI9GW_001060 [Halieaceae bacterium]|jgi:hypothetical protein